MEVAKLAALCEVHKLDRNYQHREKSWEQIDQLAAQSFAKLTPTQAEKVVKVCQKYGIKGDEIARYRFMAQTNLFFLCKLLEKYGDVSDKEYVWKDGTIHNTHEEICNEFFVRKNPLFKTFKEFAVDYEKNKLDKRERLLLVPRGGFKSSMDMADCVQWIVCFPEVTIMILTGRFDLANDFVAEIKGHFTLEEGGDLGLFYPKKSYKPRTMLDGTINLFQVLFPEHTVPTGTGTSDTYQTPACAAPDKETSVFAASIEQSLVGWHVGVMKLDDVVTNENSQTADRIKNINKQVSINQAMLHPYGFYDKIGTWYDSEDTYGQDIKNAQKFAEDGDDFPMKIYIRPAWWKNLEAEKTGLIEEEMKEKDWEFWFNDPENPNSLTYDNLRKKKKTDPYFAIKYLNDPTQMHVIKFPRELLVRKTVHASEIPDTGMIVTTVDTAYTTNSWSDYTVIITSLIYGGKFYIIDMKRGKYSEYELPQMIANTVLQWKPKRVCIEETGAIKYIQREVYREMDKLKVRAPIELVGLGQGNKNKNSKKVKAGPVLRFIGDDRLKFVNTCPSLDELYDELSKFGTAASQHDDIVDALAILVNQFGNYADVEARMTAASTEYVNDPKGKLWYDQTYGLGKFDKFNAKNLPLEFPDVSPAELQKNAVLDAVEANHDPLSDLF